MKSSDAPSKQSVPFGVNGSRQSILDTTPTGSNAASYDVGFPPITMILKSAGGLPPLGQNWNQILYELSGISRFLSAGGGYVYDSTFSTAVGGYPAGAVIPNSTLNGLWINTVDDNTTNPENSTSALTGWVPAFSYGTTSFTGLTSGSVTVGTLDASKDVITLTGLLTANINLVLPAWIKKWDIVNNTTGAFTVTVKTPSGTGVAVSSGSKIPVIGDGTNINANYPAGSLISRRIFTSNATYSPTVGTRSVVVEVQAGGGGGGGAGYTSSTTVSIGAGGGAGGYAKSYLTSGFSSQAIVVGAGGAGGNITPTNGSTGGTSSFGSIISCNGGVGGVGQSQATAGYTATAGTGGSASGGNTQNQSGQPGTHGVSISNSNNWGGSGGSCPLGSGGFGPANNNVSPTASSGYGSGGAGGVSQNSPSTGRVGTAGSPGVVIIWEYA